MNIGENLKRLRKAKNITQEGLAEFLGVSFQSVSKWEREDCFPDITMLPGLANFFEISVDELLGIDQVQNQNRLNDIFKLAHEYEEANRYQEAIQLLQKALKDFPNHYGLQSELAISLSLDETSDNIKSKREAIVLCERVLANCASEKVRGTTRVALCFLYESVDEHQKAIDLANTFPHVWESRELALLELFDRYEYADSLRRCIYTILSILCDKIDKVDYESKLPIKMIALGQKEINFTPENKLVLLEKIAKFI